MTKVRNSGTTKTLYGITFIPSYWYEVPDDMAQQLTKKNKDFELEQGEASAPSVSPLVEDKILEDIDLSSMTKKELFNHLTGLGIPCRSFDSKAKLLNLALSHDEEE